MKARGSEGYVGFWCNGLAKGQRMATETGFLKLAAELTQRTDVTADSFIPLAEEIVQRRTGASGVSTAQLGSEPKRYIVAPSAVQKSAGPSVRANLRSIHDEFKSSILRSEHEDGRKVMQMTPLEAALLKERYGSLVVEEDVQHRMARSPLLPVPASPVVPASAATFKVMVECAGRPLSGVSVVLMTDVANNVGYEARTDAQGVALVSVLKSDVTFERVVIDSRAGYWSKVMNNVTPGALGKVSLAALPIAGFGWGQLDTQAPAQGSILGNGVRVAIIDSGVGAHPSLVVKGRNFILNEPETDWNKDDDGHGTHCAGVIAALQSIASTWGYAPRAEVFALRVFGGADGGGYASDIGDAIKWAVDNDCDIISMSLSTSSPSSYIRKQIELANDAGVLCIAATGNDAGPVSYPAKFRDVVGVAAIGRFDAYPKDSAHAFAETSLRSTDGRYYLASFSNRSGSGEDDVDFCAPGIAVPSTLPGGEFGAWDGTSMACPHLSGIAALALGTSQLKGMARSAARRDLLHDRLIAAALDLGIGRTYTGTGLPLLSRVLGP
jgi:subtilisin family serine protease